MLHQDFADDTIFLWVTLAKSKKVKEPVLISNIKEKVKVYVLISFILHAVNFFRKNIDLIQNVSIITTDRFYHFSLLTLQNIMCS